MLEAEDVDGWTHLPLASGGPDTTKPTTETGDTQMSYNNPFQQQNDPVEEHVRRQLLLPTITSTIVVTALFGVLFGLIPAIGNSNKARALGVPTNKYWKAYGWTAGASIVGWILFWVLLAAIGNSANNSYQAQLNRDLANASSFANNPLAGANTVAGTDISSEVTVSNVTCDSVSGTTTGTVSWTNNTGVAATPDVAISLLDFISSAGSFSVYSDSPVAPGTTWTYNFNVPNSYTGTDNSCTASVDSAMLQ